MQWKILKSYINMGNQWLQDNGVIVWSQTIRGGGFGINKKGVFSIRINANQTKKLDRKKEI